MDMRQDCEHAQGTRSECRSVSEISEKPCKSRETVPPAASSTHTAYSATQQLDITRLRLQPASVRSDQTPKGHRQQRTMALRPGPVERNGWQFTCLLLLLLLAQVCAQDSENDIMSVFNPSVSASCNGKLMTINVNTQQPFSGIVHTKDRNKDYRNSACSATGNGDSRTVSLVINQFASPGDPDYCGVNVNEKTDNKKVTIAVRMHKTLELVEDKYFTISCNKQGFRNARSEVSRVSLKFIEDNKKVNVTVQGRQYTLRAETSKPDGIHRLKVINCFGFSVANSTEVQLIDSKGCPVVPMITRFSYDEGKFRADATIFNMFKFPDSRRAIIQCEVMTCSGPCAEESCPPVGTKRPKPRTTESSSDAEGNLLISTAVYVVEPGEAFPEVLPLTDCSIHRWSWLLGLCIAFGVLFLIMLIINIFLCSALTCTCTRQEIIEKEPSVIEDYDPYKGGWASGSQYGSRYSLNGKQGYTSGGSTLNSTTRSVSTNSDHYAIVHSHPGSRYSGPGSHKGGPSSTLSNGQYNHGYNGRL